MPQRPMMHPADPWDSQTCRALINELWSLRRAMLENEQALAALIEAVDPGYRPSARNLAHYLAFRRDDRRVLQDRLAWLGLSSLGRAESHVLANLDKVLGILHRLVGEPWHARSKDEPAGIRSSRGLLDRHTEALLGPTPPGRGVRIMVTLPSEAARDFGFVRQLVATGMDIARINCAHDGADDWRAMAAHVRRAAKAAGRPVRVLMDLGGPKLRTGAIRLRAPVLKLQPQRDDFGRVLAPARIGLRPAGQPGTVPGAPVDVGVDAGWLARLHEGDRIDLTDARGARRRLTVVRHDAAGTVAECPQAVYLVPETRLKRRRPMPGRRTTIVSDLPCPAGFLRLERGSRLLLTPEERDGTAVGSDAELPRVACTLPEVFAQLSAGERIWFDDGRIGGVIRGATADGIEVEITDARDRGEKLYGDKGINLPDSALDLPALTPKDVKDLATVAREADLVGLSFVQRAVDVKELRDRLAKLGAADRGIVLKIETRRGFENLPEILLAAMACKAAGVMIARGDLAVECGYERLAEVQEEMLWAAEAAHLPVIWATQVLETLAKTGQPSRAEITDAAMGERAECVMLNKGPHILDAMRTLDDILRRMQAHQTKKRPLLRALGAWNPPARAAAG